MPDTGEPTGRIVTIGGSAGAIEALRHLVRHLPSDFPAPICVVIHIAPDSPGLVPSIIQSAGALRAQHAEHGGTLRPGHIYIAPPDRHLVLNDKGGTLLGVGPKENLFRPAIDPLFRSAALAYGAGCMGVILSGGLDDGAAGIAAIKAAGGIAIVQQPEEAAVASMPEAALAAAAIDHCLPTSMIAERLSELARQPAGKSALPTEVRAAMDIESRIAAGAESEKLELKQLGELSNFTCPECAGVLRRMNTPPLRFRCHTGHAHTSETLAYAYRKRSDDALWAALERLREQAMFLWETASDNPAALNEPKGPASEASQVDKLADALRALLNKARDPVSG